MTIKSKSWVQEWLIIGKNRKEEPYKMNECDLAIVMFPNCWIFYPIKDKEKQIR
jgi:hypothetical protein